MSIRPGTTSLPEAGGWQRLSIRRSFVLLMIPVVLLTLMSLLMWHLLRVTPNPRWSYVLLGDLFNVDREVNLPTWFSAGLWLCSGLVAGFLARWSLTRRRSWALFAALCLLLSVDEATMLHERLNPVGAVLAERLGVDLRYGWVLPGVLIAAAIGLFLLRFVLALPRKARLGILLAGVVFVAGAVGGEVLSDIAARGTPVTEYPGSPTYIAFNAAEEFLEMTGVALCLASLLSLLSRRRDGEAVTWTVAERTGSGVATAGSN